MEDRERERSAVRKDRSAFGNRHIYGLGDFIKTIVPDFGLGAGKSPKGLYTGVGMGTDSLDDMESQLEILLKQWEMPVTPDNREWLLETLIQTTANKGKYDPYNPMFDPALSEYSGKSVDAETGEELSDDPIYAQLDRGAAEIVGIWAQENMGQKYNSLPDLWDNFGDHYRAESNLTGELKEYLGSLLGTGVPEIDQTSDTHIENAEYQMHKIYVDEEHVGDFPVFADPAINAKLRELNRDPIIDQILASSIDPQMNRFANLGSHLMRNDPKALENVSDGVTKQSLEKEFQFLDKIDPDKKYNPNDVIVRFNTTPQGLAFNPSDALTKIQAAQETLVAGEKGLLPHELSELRELATIGDLEAYAKLEEIKTEARNRTRADDVKARVKPRLTYHDDPEGVIDALIKDEPLPGGWVEIAPGAYIPTGANSFEPGSVAAFAIRDVGNKLVDGAMFVPRQLFPGTFGDLPNRMVNALAAVHLPRVYGGYTTDEEGNAVLSKEGELAGPLTGDFVGANQIDYALKSISLIDEAYTRAFAQAINREIKEGNGIKGRTGRIFKYMAEIVGTPENIRYIANDAWAGGVFMQQFGEAFIRPQVAAVLGESQSEELRPLTDRVGQLMGIGAMMLTPSAFEAISIAKAGVKGGINLGSDMARVNPNQVIGIEAQNLLTFLKEIGVDDLTNIKDPEVAEDVAAKLNEYIRNQPGDTAKVIELLSSANSAMATNLTGSMRSNNAGRIFSSYSSAQAEAAAAGRKAEKAAQMSAREGLDASRRAQALVDEVVFSVQQLTAQYKQEMAMQNGIMHAILHEKSRANLTKLSEALGPDGQYVRDILEALNESGTIGDVSKNGKLITMAQKLVNQTPELKGMDLTDLIGSPEGHMMVRSLLADSLRRVVNNAPTHLVMENLSDLQIKNLNRVQQSSMATILGKLDEVDLRARQLMQDDQLLAIQNPDGTVTIKGRDPGRASTDFWKNQLNEAIDAAANLHKEAEASMEMFKRQSSKRELMDYVSVENGAKIQVENLRVFSDYLRNMKKFAEAGVVLGKLKGKEYRALQAELVGKTDAEFASQASKGELPKEQQELMNMLREDLSKLTDAPLLSMEKIRSLHGKLRTLNEEYRAAARAKEDIVFNQPQGTMFFKSGDILKLDRLNARQAEIKNEAKALREANNGKLSPEEAAARGGEPLSDPDWLRRAAEPHYDTSLIRFDNEGAPILSVRMIENLLMNPKGMVHLGLRNQLRPLNMFRNKRASAIYIQTTLKEFYEATPAFRIRQRFLDQKLAVEVDDIAKGMSNRATSFKSAINLIWEHVGQRSDDMIDPRTPLKTAGERVLEAHNLVVKLLEKNDGKAMEIETRYRLLPLTKRMKLSLWTTAGRGVSMVDRFLAMTVDLGLSMRHAPSQSVAHNYALDGLITSSIDDAKFTGQARWESQILPDIRAAVYDWLLKSHVKDGEYVPGNIKVDDLLTKIREIVEEVKPNVQIPRYTPNAKHTRVPDVKQLDALNKAYEAIGLGALIGDTLNAVSKRVGSRVTNQMALALNELMSQGQANPDLNFSRAFKTDDTVWLRVDAEKWNETTYRQNSPQLKGLQPMRTEGERTQGTVRRGRNADDPDTYNMETREFEGDDVRKAFPRDPIKEKLGAESQNVLPLRINRIYTYEGNKLVELDSVADSSRALVDLYNPNTGKMMEGVSLVDVVHRNTSFSILDAGNAAIVWGIDILDSAGVKNAKSNYKNAYSATQELVSIGMASDGFSLRQAPLSLVENIVNLFDKNIRDLSEALDPGVAATLKVPLVTRNFRIYNPIALQILRASRAMIGFWKTAILVGYFIPRLGFFSSQRSGDLSQAQIQLGYIDSTALIAYGSLAYLPGGLALQKGVGWLASKAPDSIQGLTPSLFSSMFNGAFLKILEGGDTWIPQLGKTAGEILEEMDMAGVREGFMTQDHRLTSAASLRNAIGTNPSLLERGDKIYRFGQDEGVTFLSAHRYMMDLIQESTMRQRALLYLDRRINKGDTPEQARSMLHKTWYDWTHSVHQYERDYIGQMTLFYTLQKNAFAQFLRMFDEFGESGTKEYAKRYATMQTQLQRFRGQTSLQQATGDQIDPWEEQLGSALRKKIADKFGRPRYADDRPVFSEGRLSKYAQRLQLSQGYLKPYYAANVKQASMVDQFLLLFQAMTAMQAMAVASARYFDEDGKLVPLSANGTRGMKMMGETIGDIMLPIYAEAFEAQMQSLRRDHKFKSPDGRKMRKGDMAMYQFMKSLGTSDYNLGAMVTLTPTKGGPEGEKRIAFNYLPDPLVDFFFRQFADTGMRAAGYVALVFPDMTHEEILVYANENPTDFELRMRGLNAALGEVGYLAWDPDAQLEYTLRDYKLSLDSMANSRKQYAQGQINGSYEGSYYLRMPSELKTKLRRAYQQHVRSLGVRQRIEFDRSPRGMSYYLLMFGTEHPRLTEEFKASKAYTNQLDMMKKLDWDEYPIELMDSYIVNLQKLRK